MYSKETIFHLPGIFSYAGIYQVICREYTENPHKFKDNVKIGSIYGCPGGIWNGGRILHNKEKCKEELEDIRDLFANFGVPIRFTFTNCLIDETLAQDAYCNMLLEIFNNGHNEIICNTPALENHIRSKYGDRYKYISSTTKRLNNQEDQLTELDKDYYLVVLDYDHNKDYEFMESIENKDKCEILCNPVCVAKCPNRKKHYENISYCQIYHSIDMMECPEMDKRYYQVKRLPNYISPQDINDIYLPMGFSNFKLEGRTHDPFDLTEILLDYLIKEEYQLEMRGILHKLIISNLNIM